MGSSSLQGDMRFAEVMTAMGARVEQGDDWTEVGSPGLAAGFRPRAIDADFNHIPDAAMPAAVVALFADGPSVLRNLGSWSSEAPRVGKEVVRTCRYRWS